MSHVRMITTKNHSGNCWKLSFDVVQSWQVTFVLPVLLKHLFACHFAPNGLLACLEGF